MARSPPWQEAERPGNGHETCIQAVAGEVGTDSRAGLELASSKERIYSFATHLEVTTLSNTDHLDLTRGWGGGWGAEWQEEEKCERKRR